MPLRAWHGISTPQLSDTLPAAHAPHVTALALFLTFSTSTLSGLGRLGSPWRGTVAHATIVPACCHLSLYIVTICRRGLCSRSPQSTSQGATVCAGTHKGGMAPIMARGQQAGVSVGTEHASCRSSSSALQHGDSPERRNN